MAETRSRAQSAGGADVADAPPHRYAAALANQIEAHWQDRWKREATFRAPNPGEEGFERLGDAPKQFILDMFPYPSGAGLHVGHPLGYIATDITARYWRMRGRNVLHAMGYDAFGLPAEQYAVQTGQHPRVTTEQNIARMREQLARLGLGHDDRRSVATTDVGFYKWTQWIFLQIYNSWYDEKHDRARPIDDLIEEFEQGVRQPVDPIHNPHGAAWAELTQDERRRVVDARRLAYVDEIPVNWCPGLGTVLANEEVTADGRSERGNFPVFKRPLKQWMMRITVYAERLLKGLEQVDWPEPIKLMQRNWIGRSEGAIVHFPACDQSIDVFTTRPDTLFGATYMVLAPEHPLVDVLAADAWPDGTPDKWKGEKKAKTPREAIDAYRAQAAGKSDVERQVERKTKTGVFIGAYATNPANEESIPVFIADYVLMGYGTGAIMAVPGQDQRDWDFAKQFELPIVRTVQPPEDFEGEAYVGEGPAIDSGFLDGLGVADAKRKMIDWLAETGKGTPRVNFKLRDWLFSRQRYWGEPFPIVWDEADNPIALPESMLPVTLPEMEDFAPRVRDEHDQSPPEPPLGRADEWKTVTLDLGDGPREYRRELNTMPNWAGSCWYYLRYLDPENDAIFCDPEIERYWMLSRKDGSHARAGERYDAKSHKAGGVDLYVGGAEHAVLHLLYARFWHKVLYDLGHVSTPEPFTKLFNQGYIQAPAFTDARGAYVPVEQVKEEPPGSETFTFEGEPITREFGKMGKSLKNVIAPDDVCAEFGADTLRLYEMYMGPLEASKPWNTRDIIGVHRFLQRLWRNVVDEESGQISVVDETADDETKRALHKTIAGVRADVEALSFNTAIAKLIELNNHLTRVAADRKCPREVAEPLALMLAPFAPHMAEELWSRLGRAESLAHEAFPEADEAFLVDETIEIPVQIGGKVRTKLHVAPETSKDDLEALAMADEKVKQFLEGKTVRKVVVVPGRLINIVAT